MFRSHLRPETSVPTADLNASKRLEFPVWSSSTPYLGRAIAARRFDRVDDLGDGRLEGLDRGLDVSERQLEIRDVPDLPFGSSPAPSG